MSEDTCVIRVPGANDAAELVDFSGDLDQLLRAIGRMLRRSGKNRKRLDELATAYCGEGKVCDATVPIARDLGVDTRVSNAERRARKPTVVARLTTPSHVPRYPAVLRSVVVVGARRSSSLRARDLDSNQLK